MPNLEFYLILEYYLGKKDLRSDSFGLGIRIAIVIRNWLEGMESCSEWKFFHISVGFNRINRFDTGFIRIKNLKRLKDWEGFKRIKKSFQMRLGFIRIDRLDWNVKRSTDLKVSSNWFRIYSDWEHGISNLWNY